MTPIGEPIEENHTRETISNISYQDHNIRKYLKEILLHTIGICCHLIGVHAKVAGLQWIIKNMLIQEEEPKNESKNCGEEWLSSTHI